MFTPPPQRLSQTHSTTTPLGLLDSSENQATLYTGPYQSSVGFLATDIA